MTFKLGSSIKVGHKIKIYNGWYTVTEVTMEGAITERGLIKFGTTVYGWKSA